MRIGNREKRRKHDTRRDMRKHDRSIAIREAREVRVDRDRERVEGLRAGRQVDGRLATYWRNRLKTLLKSSRLLLTLVRSSGNWRRRRTPPPRSVPTIGGPGVRTVV